MKAAARWFTEEETMAVKAVADDESEGSASNEGESGLGLGFGLGLGDGGVYREMVK